MNRIVGTNMRAACLIVLSFFTFTTSILAQDPGAIAAAEAACGPKNVNFDVKDDNTQHTVAQPEAGKALVYVIQELGQVNCIGGCLTSKIGMDGAWIGANHRNSYLLFAVDPGEHHLCVRWQSHIDLLSQTVGLTRIDARAGEIYFFRTRTVGVGPNFFDFEPIDGDLGKLFVASLPMSVSHPKK